MGGQGSSEFGRLMVQISGAHGVEGTVSRSHQLRFALLCMSYC